MYCGCNEKALSSQRAIACALLGLMEAEPYAAISISGICRAAGVSRPTFYSLFGSKDDVVAYILRESYCYEPSWEESACTELESLCRGYSRYITAERHFLSLLVANGIGHLLYESIRTSLLDCGCFLSGAETASRHYAANFAAGALTGVAQDYVTREACSADELGALLAQLFSGSYFLT